MDVRIIDRYNLSKQYTPQTIMDVYYDSILFELEKYWTLEYNLLKNSTWEFEKDDLLVLTLEDGFLARTYADDLKEYFQLIFLNRFGFEIDVEYKYVAKLEKRYEKENEHKLNLRIKQIEDNFMAAGEEAKSDNGAEKNKKYAEQKAKAAAFFNERGASGKDLTRYRKPANTDILYGRDFDDEVTAIEQIESPIGEVVINGMIRSIETREIRNERTILSIVVTDFTDSIVVKMFARNEQLPDLYEFIKKAKYIAASTKEVIRDAMGLSYKRKMITIMEIMGRNAGWLTGATALAKTEDCCGPDLIYLPEIPFDVDRFLKKCSDLLEKKPSIVIAVSEGIKVPDGRYVCQLAGGSDYVDAFGHRQLAGTAGYLASFLAAKTGCKTRAVELSTLQRSASHMASRVDINEAFMVGGAAVKAADEGDSGRMVVIDRVSDDPYMSAAGIYDVHKIANNEKLVPRSWVNREGNYVTREFIDYVEPLIQGDYQPFMVNGLPQHLVLKR